MSFTLERYLLDTNSVKIASSHGGVKRHENPLNFFIINETLSRTAEFNITLFTYYEAMRSNSSDEFENERYAGGFDQNLLNMRCIIIYDKYTGLVIDSIEKYRLNQLKYPNLMSILEKTVKNYQIDMLLVYIVCYVAYHLYVKYVLVSKNINVNPTIYKNQLVKLLSK
jgi:hypothetical protein